MKKEISLQKEKKTEKDLKLQKQQNEIKFYRPNHQFGYFSNFYQSPFVVKNILYKTNEHFFQSKKYEGLPQQKLVIQAKTPSQAFKLGRNKKFPRRNDWQKVKEDVMYEGLKYKFNTHKELKNKLLQTKDKKLIEHTHKDSYWADGGNGSGKNRLGVLLMKLRSQFQKEIKKQRQK